MSVSRDETREIVAVALMLAIGLRILSGVFQVLDELDRRWTWSSLVGRLVSPITATVGLLCIGLVLLLVLSPAGSISMRSNRIARGLTATVTVLGVLSVFNVFVFRLGTWQQQFGRLSQELLIATLLAGTGWFLLRNFDSGR